MSFVTKSMVATLSAAMLFASSAKADTLQPDDLQITASFSATTAKNSNGTFYVPVVNQYSVEGDPGWYSICVDFYSPYAAGISYDRTYGFGALSLSDEREQLLDRLLTGGIALLDSQVSAYVDLTGGTAFNQRYAAEYQEIGLTSNALQLLTWEITSGDKIFDVESGNFRFVRTNHTSAEPAMWATINTFEQNLRDGTWSATGGVEVQHWANDTKQDFIVVKAVPVPEPSGAMLVLVGGILALTRRSRSQAARR